MSYTFLTHKKLSYRREIVSFGGHYTPFKVVQGNWFWYQSKTRMQRPISE